MRDRKELEQHLVDTIQKIRRKRSDINDIKLYLAEKHDVMAGTVQEIINNPEEKLPKLEVRELFLITEQVFMKSGVLEINPEKYFTNVEAKSAHTYSESIKREDFDFPITFTNATVVGNAAYMVTMSVQTINKLIESQLLGYDFELQREAKFIRQKDNSIRIQPTLNKKNVEEIEEHLIEGTLVPTVLVFNAMTRSSDTGDELVYDASKLELTITPGTELSIVDGFHRCKASQRALLKDPNLNFNFAVLITNYSKKKAQTYQAQLAKQTPVSKVRAQELEANRLSDAVVQQLKDESDLKGRISQTNQIRKVNNELVTYNVLADTIDEQFPMNTRADSMDVGDFLVEYFNALIGSHPEEFIDNVEQTRKVSLIADNNMFVGYIVLARRMFDKGIKARQVRKIIRQIDFNRTADIWKELRVVDEQGRIERDTVKLRKNIKNYFEQLNIEEMLEV